MASSQQSRAAVLALLLIGAGGLVAAVLLLRQRSAPQGGAPPGPQLFAPDSVWNNPLTPGAATDPQSRGLVRKLTSEVRTEQQKGTGPYIATGLASTPLYVAGRGQKRVPVKLGPTGTPGAAALRRALRSVPIPAGARPAAGSDAHLAIWQPSTDTMWELFEARHQRDGWRAAWGGAMRDVSRNAGYYTPAAWPGATYEWGATATSLPVVGGTVLGADIRSGRIDHALSLALPAPRRRVFAWPAQRSDGTGGPAELPEGAKLRLDPRLDLASLRLPPPTLMLAEAAQRYGLIVRDQTHHAIGLYFQDPASVGGNPYRAFFSGLTPNRVLAAFPWSHLQVLRLHLCTHAPCTTHGAGKESP